MVNPEIGAVIFGLVAAASWGAGDFSGGFATKSSSVLGVLLVVHLVSVILLPVFAIWFESPAPNAFSLAAAVLSGAAGVFGMSALYKGLASGKMGLVAPIAAVTTAALPVFMGMFLEGFPSFHQIVGFAIAFTAIWLLSVPEETQAFQWRQIKLPITAGILLGLSMIFIDQAAEWTVLWSLVVARLTGLAVLLALFLILRKGSMPSKQNYPVACLAGILDTGGITFYTLAANTGRLDIAASLSSMYPATTVMLAWLIFKERLSGRQRIGVLSALIAIILIAT
jgi:drug/metabolite transporter (DMT)-like permease